VAAYRYHVELEDGNTRRTCWVDKRMSPGHGDLKPRAGLITRRRARGSLLSSQDCEERNSSQQGCEET
jgi:hypothetical protein